MFYSEYMMQTTVSRFVSYKATFMGLQVISVMNLISHSKVHMSLNISGFSNAKMMIWPTFGSQAALWGRTKQCTALIWHKQPWSCFSAYAGFVYRLKITESQDKKGKEWKDIPHLNTKTYPKECACVCVCVCIFYIGKSEYKNSKYLNSLI